MERKKIRRRYRFYGRVQGVGFRYRAMYICQGLDLTGWVTNEYDGSVTMEVQGDSLLMGRMVQQLADQRFIEIEDFDMKEIPLIENDYDFRIR